jgi:glycopeptide antibiotics resistance protein
MLMPLGLIAFWPNPVDAPVQEELAKALKFLHAFGIPSWFNYQLVEATANVALFIPLGAVATLAYPKIRLWQVGIFGLIVSACIELGQLLFLHNRFASALDIVTNTGGAVIGALVLAAALKRLQSNRWSEAGL